MSKLNDCCKCGCQPNTEVVFGTGEYYKCKKCDFPSFQFPISNTSEIQIRQWNKLNNK